MSRSIKVVTAGSVQEGQYIVQADADYPLGSIVPADDYDPAEQDWQHVRKTGGHADIGWLELAYYNGETYRVNGDWSQTVWLELDEDGEPVWQDPSERN